MKSYMWAGAAALVLIVVAWMFRWQPIPFSTAPLPRIFALDRWTGKFYLVDDSDGVIEVGPLIKPKP